LRGVVTEEEVIGRARRLIEAESASTTTTDGEGLKGFAEKRKEEEERAGAGGEDSWKALLSLFKANSREELVTLLGFSKEELGKRVEGAVLALKASKRAASTSTSQSEGAPQDEDDHDNEEDEEEEEDAEEEDITANERTTSVSYTLRYAIGRGLVRIEDDPCIRERHLEHPRSP
jgi:protein transport protein SEC31